MEQFKNKKSYTEPLAETKPASTPLEINSIQDFLRWVFIESSAKWLFMILLFEYIVAVNLSPTILTDYPIFNWVVEKLSFIPAVHNFDDIAVHPEAVRFYIVLTTILLIPKSASIYYTLAKKPITGMAAFVITPYTITKPTEMTRMFVDSWKLPDNVTAGPQQPRSMFSRVFWSLAILIMCTGLVWAYHYGVAGHPLQMRDFPLLADNSLWLEFSTTAIFSALLIAISSFIIKDYIRLFVELFQHRTRTSK
jgi:hypothetical protein